MPAFNRIYPDRAIAIYSRKQAEMLVKYHHHGVCVEGCQGVRLTLEWLPVEAHTDPFVLTVVFHFPGKHPRAAG